MADKRFSLYGSATFCNEYGNNSRTKSMNSRNCVGGAVSGFARRELNDFVSLAMYIFSASCLFVCFFVCLFAVIEGPKS